jgi:hypothetical protein
MLKPRIEIGHVTADTVYRAEPQGSGTKLLRAFRQKAASGAGKNRQLGHAFLAGLGVRAASIGCH